MNYINIMYLITIITCANIIMCKKMDDLQQNNENNHK